MDKENWDVMIPAKGPFLNYVQQILPITYPWLTFVKIFFYCKSYMENLHRVDISSTTYQPHLVNVVKERPPQRPDSWYARTPVFIRFSLLHTRFCPVFSGSENSWMYALPSKWPLWSPGSHVQFYVCAHYMFSRILIFTFVIFYLRKKNSNFSCMFLNPNIFSQFEF